MLSEGKVSYEFGYLEFGPNEDMSLMGASDSVVWVY